MSLILDALNKNERERQAPRHVPDLATGPHYSAPAPMPHSKLLWGGLILLAMLVVALGIALLLKSRQPQVIAPPAPLAANPAPPPAANPLAAPAREPVQAWRPLPPPTATPTSVTPAAAPPTAEDIAALYGTETAGIETAVIEPTGIEATDAEQPSVDRGRPIAREQMAQIWREMQTQPAPVPKSAAPAPAKPVASSSATKMADSNGLAQFVDVPFLHQLPAQQQSKIPTLMYNRHDFDGQAVILNKKRFQMGEAPAPGVIIEQIVSDGIVLSHEGRQFKLDALSSWVNR